MWVKLDDALPANRKMLRVSTPARYLYVVGLCHCAQGLTDGEIDREALPALHGFAGTRRAHVDELVKVGLWAETADGYVVPDFLEYQPSRDKVMAEREATRRRVRSHRESRRDQTAGNGERNAVTNADGTAAPSRPVPSNEEPSSPIELGAQAPEQGPPFEEFWLRYPRRNGTRQGKADAAAKWKRMTAADRQAALDGVDAYAARAGDFPKDAVRYLKAKLWLDDEPAPTGGATVVSIVGPCRCGFDGERGDPAHQEHHRRYIESLAEEG